MTHISKEFAEWLKERGCEIESETWWGTVWTKPGEIGWSIVKRPDGDGARAYTWYDILVTYSKEFWGEEKLCDDCGKILVPSKFMGKYGPAEGFECGCGFNVDPNEIPAWLHRPRIVLCYLLDNDTIEAEEYVKTHSLFAKQDL